jgi:uncharacterized membrane protein YhiD involved in acid resistance
MRPDLERILSATALQRIACVRSAASRVSRATCLSAFLLLGGAPLALAQGRADSGSASAVQAFLQSPADSAAQAPTQEGMGPHTHRASQELNHLRPVLEWSWGAVGATVLAMCGAILFVLPVALVYRRTKGQHEYDPGVTHSSIILAPTIAGVLMVIQGSLAMAFSLAGVVTAVRFRNSLKDTNDAVYVFVAVAIGLAAGGQALDIAAAISLVFCTTVLLLSRSPLHLSPPSRHHHGHDKAQATDAHAARWDPARLERLDVHAARPDVARTQTEALLERDAKAWRFEGSTEGTSGPATLTYLVYRRKRTNREQLVRDLDALARSAGFEVNFRPIIPALR